MPKFLVTYDLAQAPHDPHAEFIKQAAKEQWYPWRLIGTEFYKLPSTALFGEFDNQSHATRNFKAIADRTRNAGYRIDLTKWVLVQYTEGTLISDEKIDVK